MEFVSISYRKWAKLMTWKLFAVKVCIQPQRMLMLLHLLWQRIVNPLICIWKERPFICGHLRRRIYAPWTHGKMTKSICQRHKKNLHFSIKSRIACDIERMHVFWFFQFRLTCRCHTILALHCYAIPFREPRFYGKYCCSGSGSISFLWEEEINTFDQYWNVTVDIGNESN